MTAARPDGKAAVTGAACVPCAGGPADPGPVPDGAVSAACLRVGAERFGWESRRRGRIDNFLYGTGVAGSSGSAEFVEVRVDVDTAEIQVTRMLGVYAAGGVADQLAARSRFIGGMTRGLSAALQEGDVARNADVPAIEAVGLVSEFGFVEDVRGTATAVAEAVADATGCRITDLPIRPEALLEVTKPFARGR